MTRFWLRILTHVNVNYVNKKREVERGSTFTLMSDLSCIASIIFANVIGGHNIWITRSVNYFLDKAKNNL